MARARKTIDYTQFSTNGPQKDEGDLSSRWWTLTPDDAAESIGSTCSLLDNAQIGRRQQYIASARLYGNMPMMGFLGFNFSKLDASSPMQTDRVSYNVCQATTDTAVSRISKSKPRPYFLTNGGTYKLRRKAKKLTQFTDGVFYENNAYELGTLALRDSLVWGDGITHVFAEHGRVKYERVLPHEILIDEVEGSADGWPSIRQLHRVKMIDRQVLIAMFPDKEDVINQASSDATRETASRPNVADLLTVRESWHLPSGPEAEDGKHIITINGHALTPMMEWEHDFFPFALMQWCPRLFGAWSQGLIEQIQGLQIELNKLMRLKSYSFHLQASYKVLIEAGSKIVTEQLNRDVGAIIKYQGTKPEYINPPAVSPQLFEYEGQIKDAAFTQPGISQLAATSQKPAGIDSGRAIRAYDDIQSDRLQTPGRRYENYYLQLAKLSIATIKDILKEKGGKSYKVKYGRGWLDTVDWKNIDLDEDAYQMQCFPTSSLPNEPAGRLAAIQEFAQAGMYTLREAKRLLGFPDMEQVDSLQIAQEEWLLKCLDGIVDEGEPAYLEPFDDLNLALELGLEYYALAKCHGLEEERLELVRQFILRARGLVAESQQAALPPQGPVPPNTATPGDALSGGLGPAQTAPVAPPPSNLLPNSPQ